MTRILLIENNALDPHRLREETRRAGLCFVYECAQTRAQFLHLLANEPGMIVAACEALPQLPLDEVVRHAAEAHVPLMVVGGDTSEEREVLGELRGKVAASCRRSRLAWLPLLLDRALYESSSVASQQVADAAAEVHAAAHQMREVQKLAIIGRLSGSIAHEINNPLESITNLLYLMSVNAHLPAELRPYLDLAQQELGRVAQISKQTLSFYRESQEPVRVQLSSLLEEVLVLYGRRLSEKNIVVDQRFESEEPVLLYPGEMRQVFANLMANAIEATEPGGRIAVRIHLGSRWSHREARPVQGVRVLVADSGCGIAGHVAARLGRPFYTTKGERGTGLGLWVSKDIVERYHGEMQLRSSTAPDRHGTTFSIFLPLNLGPRVVERPLAMPSSHVGPDAGEDEVDGENPRPASGLRLRASTS